MPLLTELTKTELIARHEALQAVYDDYKARGLKLDMSRGKPGAEQLDLSAGLLTCVAADDYFAADGTDTRNYGILCGIPEARQLFGDIFGVPAANVIVGGNASLTLMYDYLSTAYWRGVCGGKPWAEQAPKFLCPVPGYDRHFAITEFLGIEMINVPLGADGPDMDMVEELVKDPSVKVCGACQCTPTPLASPIRTKRCGVWPRCNRRRRISASCGITLTACITCATRTIRCSICTPRPKSWGMRIW